MAEAQFSPLTAFNELFKMHSRFTAELKRGDTEQALFLSYLTSSEGK